MKKVGILTYFWAENCGTFLQAYSMQRALARRLPACRVELIDLRHRSTAFRLRKTHLILPRLVQDLRRRRRFQASRTGHLVRSEEAILTDDHEVASEFLRRQDYDLIVVGADTVLQLLPEYSRRGQPPVYWLPADLDAAKVVFSASCHALRADTLDQPMRARLAESLNAFDLVGVRDDATEALVRDLGLRDPEKLHRTPDPTVTFDIDYGPIDRLLARAKIDLDRPTLGINLPRQCPLREPVIRQYKDRGFQVLGLNFTPSAHVRLSDLSPFEWAGIYRYFRLTVTDRFHGSIFSLKNATPVVAVDTSASRVTRDGDSKTRSLLKEFGLARTHHVNDSRVSSLEGALGVTGSAVEKFDAGAVGKRVREMRRTFDAFLEKVASLVG